MSSKASLLLDLDAVFKALANPVRRQICDALGLRPLTTKQLAEAFAPLDRTTVMMHLSVLEQAGLVVAVRKGRERFNYLDAMPIQAIHDRWIGPHAARAAQGLARLKGELESQSSDPARPELVEGPTRATDALNKPVLSRSKGSA